MRHSDQTMMPPKGARMLVAERTPAKDKKKIEDQNKFTKPSNWENDLRVMHGCSLARNACRKANYSLIYPTF